MKLLWLALVGTLASTSSDGGEVIGTVTALYLRNSDNLVLIEMSGTPTGKPSCATHGYWLIRNQDTEMGRRQYAALLAAKVSGQTVRIIGANTCTRWSDGEDIDVVYVVP